MTVYEIPHIEHCNVEPIGSMFRITSHKGWYIHLHNGIEDTVNVWKTAVILRADYDFSIVDIRAFDDLPSDAEICGTVVENETM